jgi:hypothetical protein
VAEKVWEYGAPIWPLKSGGAVVIWSKTDVIVMPKVAEPDPLAASVTWTLKEKLPVCVGVPLTTPAKLSVSPGGKGEDGVHR